VLTCNNFSPGGGHDDPNEVVYTDVVYTPDGKTVTIYLEGTVPVTNRQSRALSEELAKAGHDYFEVAFYNTAISGPPSVPAKTVRASWELRTDARVSGVTRGVDYQYTSVTTSVVDPTPTRSAAILFVGKKTDRTLLGVGKLTGSTNIDGTPGTTTITTNTKSVTFTVDALQGFVGDQRKILADSSFLTSFLATTNPPTSADIDVNNTDRYGVVGGLIRDYQVAGKGFPLFKLRENRLTYASYKFFVASGDNFGDYTGGIIQAGVGSYGKKQPRYPAPDGNFQYVSAVRLDDRTKVTAVDNNLAGNIGLPFQNPVVVEFDTRDQDGRGATVPGSLFGFVFEIPVYPLSSAAATGGTEPGMWYIRTSYDSYWLDLDDGKEYSRGGAVLIGTGETGQYSDYKIVLKQPPLKFKYSPSETYEFVIQGLEIEMQTDPGGTPIRTIPYEELNFTIGGWRVDGAWSSQPLLPLAEQYNSPGTNIRPELYGMQIIKAEYIDPFTGKDYSVSFPIICSGGDPLRDYTDIPDSHVIYVDSDIAVDTDALASALGAIFSSYVPDTNPPRAVSGTYIIILSGSIDFSSNSSISLLSSPVLWGPFLIIFLAAPDNDDDVIVVGRGTHTTAVFMDWSRQNAFYFGTWPFGQLTAGRRFRGSGWRTAPNNTWTGYAKSKYVINAGGPGSSVTATGDPDNPYTATPPAYTGDLPTGGSGSTNKFFINSGQIGRIYNVVVEDGISLLNEYWLR